MNLVNKLAGGYVFFNQDTSSYLFTYREGIQNRVVIEEVASIVEATVYPNGTLGLHINILKYIEDNDLDMLPTQINCND